MGFISYFSASPGTGFSCLNCRFAGNLFGCCESFLCLQSGKAEPGSRVGDVRVRGEQCGHHGAVRRVNGYSGEDVFPPPLHHVLLSICFHLGESPGASLVPDYGETHPRCSELFWGGSPGQC